MYFPHLIEIEAQRNHAQGQTVCKLWSWHMDGRYLTSEPAYITTILGLPNNPAWLSPYNCHPHCELWIQLDTQRLCVHSSDTPLVASCVFPFFHSPIHLSIHPPIHPPTHPFTRTIMSDKKKQSQHLDVVGLWCLTISPFFSCLICKMGIIIIITTYLLGLLWGLNEVIHVKLLEQWLAVCNCYYITIIYYYFNYIILNFTQLAKTD